MSNTSTTPFWKSSRHINNQINLNVKSFKGQGNNYSQNPLKRP